MLCYLDFSVSTTGMLAGIKVLHLSQFDIARTEGINPHASVCYLYFEKN